MCGFFSWNFRKWPYDLACSSLILIPPIGPRGISLYPYDRGHCRGEFIGACRTPVVFVFGGSEQKLAALQAHYPIRVSPPLCPLSPRALQFLSPLSFAVCLFTVEPFARCLGAFFL